MLKYLKISAWLEGISMLLLFGVAMPLKYAFDSPMMVEIVGMAHGVLFVLYVLLAVFMQLKVKWSLVEFAIIIIASFIPFGTFYVDKKYFSEVRLQTIKK